MLYQNLPKSFVITVDGYSSCGKSTLAKQLAEKLGFIYIDTGAMYRAVTLFAIENELISGGEIRVSQLINRLPEIQIEFRKNKSGKKSDTWLNGRCVEDEIRGMEVSSYVSRIAEIGEVRSKMVGLQRQMGESGQVVMDGRDIGTVVFPHAQFKLFMTASEAVRAKRRYDELIAKKQDVSIEEITENIAKRDHIDTTRKISPLQKADDAIVLDNSNLNPREQLEWVLNLLKKYE